jgi:hypothetical protein
VVENKRDRLDRRNSLNGMRGTAAPSSPWDIQKFVFRRPSAGALLFSTDERELFNSLHYQNDRRHLQPFFPAGFSRYLAEQDTQVCDRVISFFRLRTRAAQTPLRAATVM